MTNFHLEILVHHSMTKCALPDPSPCHAAIMEELESNGMIRCSAFTKSAPIDLTDKGKAWLDRVLATPMPVQKWVWDE